MTKQDACGQQVRLERVVRRLREGVPTTEVGNIYDGITACVSDVSAAEQLMREAADEIERLCKDAERYRWLRDQPWGELFYYDSDGEHRKHFCNSISAGNQLGAAIDAAMLLTPNAGA